MTKTILRTLATSAMFLALVRAQTPASGIDLACVTYLELPTRGLHAARAGSSGTVFAAGRIGKKGRLTLLQLRGGNRGLQGEVRVAMNLSQFAARCEDRTIKFVFAFKLEDPPTYNLIPPGVRFVPPNRFELIFRRLRPILDLAPPTDTNDRK